MPKRPNATDRAHHYEAPMRVLALGPRVSPRFSPTIVSRRPGQPDPEPPARVVELLGDGALGQLRPVVEQVPAVELAGEAPNNREPQREVEGMPFLLVHVW